MIETICGLWWLLLIAGRTGFRLRGPYWRWRFETAFGADRSRLPSRRERLRAMLSYARWVHRMRRQSVSRW